TVTGAEQRLALIDRLQVVLDGAGRGHPGDIIGRRCGGATVLSAEHLSPHAIKHPCTSAPMLPVHLRQLHHLCRCEIGSPPLKGSASTSGLCLPRSPTAMT